MDSVEHAGNGGGGRGRGQSAMGGLLELEQRIDRLVAEEEASAGDRGSNHADWYHETELDQTSNCIDLSNKYIYDYNSATSTKNSTR